MKSVAVIIPTYNRSEKIKETIESVLEQSVLPNEIIIVDDCSDVEHFKELKQYILSLDFPIKLHQSEVGQGACASRNKGAQLATSEIFMFLDDDDTWEKKKIENQMNAFEEDSKVGLVYSGRLMVSDENRNKVLYEIPPKAKGSLYPDILYSNLIGTTSSVAIKREVFAEANGFDTELPAMQDYDLWIRASKLTMISHDNACNVRYTVTSDPNNQISGKSEKHLVAVESILNKYKKEIKELGFIGERKVKAARYFSIAKAQRRRTYSSAYPYIFKSFIYYPSLKPLSLLLPNSFHNMAKSIYHSAK